MQVWEILSPRPMPHLHSWSQWDGQQVSSGQKPHFSWRKRSSSDGNHGGATSPSDFLSELFCIFSDTACLPFVLPWCSSICHSPSVNLKNVCCWNIFLYLRAPLHRKMYFVKFHHIIRVTLLLAVISLWPLPLLPASLRRQLTLRNHSPQQSRDRPS